MRTLTTGSKTEHEIIGEMILLMLRHQSVEPDMPAIKRAIEEIATEFPWLSNEGTGAVNGYLISDGEVIQENFGNRQKVMRFKIRHDKQDLRRGQIYAYEKHLAKIAKELAISVICLATEVLSVLEVQMGTSFQTGQPQ